jgi:hypothetical protein
MNETPSTQWKRLGSSVVFHPDLLGPLISIGCQVSLREALGWMKAWPDDPPCNCPTVLVAGLEASLEVMDVDEADRFLRGRMNTFIREFQSHWDQRGLVFGFGCSPSCFKVRAVDEEVLFTCADGKTIHLSAGLWNGAAKEHMWRLVVLNAATSREEPAGFHVIRVS